MTSNGGDMSFEAHEVERVFDFVNLTFGAFLSAFIGIRLAQHTPDSAEVFKIAALLVEIAFVGLSFRGLGLSLVHGITTLKYAISAVVVLASGCAAYVFTCRELGYSLTLMGTIGGAWLIAPLIGIVPLMLRRWVKLY